MLNPEHVTLQQKEHWATETLSAPSQTLITFLLTRSPLCYQLSGPCVLFRTINLALFTLVKITHPDTCREGLMTAPMDRLVRSVEVDDGWLMWWLLARKLCLHFSSCTYFPPLQLFLYLLTSRTLHICLYLFLSSPHFSFFSISHLPFSNMFKLLIFPVVLSIFWHVCQPTEITPDGAKKISHLSLLHTLSLFSSFSFSCFISSTW